MTKDEALKLALEALEAIHTHADVACVVTPDGAVYLQPAITAIKEALAQPAQEPDDLTIAYMSGLHDGKKRERALWTLTKLGQEIEAQPPTHTLNSTKTVAVATDTYWLPIDKDTPRSAKLQLLTIGGIATYGNLQNDTFFYTHWCPVPKKPK